jgi:predicted acylesterase/phospholipase RssA
MNLLSFSGGATKATALAAHGRIILESGYKPDVIVGVSSGALVMLPLLLGKHELLKEYTTTLSLEDIFDCPPVNEKGKITLSSGLRGITKGYLGTMNNLKNSIRFFVSEEEFANFCRNKKSPLLYAGVTNMNNYKFKLILLNNLTYEAFIETILASASIPVFTPPVRIGKELYYDGGLIHHNPAINILRSKKYNFKECISVYSRPEVIEDYDPGYTGKSIGRTLSKTVDYLQTAVSMHDAEAEKDFCDLHNIKLIQRFSPKIMKGVYDVDNTRLKKLYDAII